MKRLKISKIPFVKQNFKKGKKILKQAMVKRNTISVCFSALSFYIKKFNHKIRYENSEHNTIIEKNN